MVNQAPQYVNGTVISIGEISIIEFFYAKNKKGPLFIASRICMPLNILKGFAKNLNEQIGNYEKEFGKIQTKEGKSEKISEKQSSTTYTS